MLTSKTQIVRSLRQLWLRSRERAEALKRDNYTCQHCKAKQSRKKGKEQKVEVHHKEGIENWDEIIRKIRMEILCHWDDLITLCPACHQKLTKDQTHPL